MTCQPPPWLPKGAPSWLRPDVHCANWGTVPDWIAAVGTVLALLLGVVVLRNELNQRWAARLRELAAQAAQVHLWSRVAWDEETEMAEGVDLLDARDRDVELLHEFQPGTSLWPREIAIANGSASPVREVLVSDRTSFFDPWHVWDVTIIKLIKWRFTPIDMRLEDDRIHWLYAPWVVQIPVLEPGETKRFRLLAPGPHAGLQVVFHTVSRPQPWVFDDLYGLADAGFTRTYMPAAMCKLIWLRRRQRPVENVGASRPMDD
jgi:hypothetical protein